MTRTCTTCAGAITPRSASGKCRDCVRKTEPLHCIKCGTSITKRSKTGHCRVCVHTPEHVEKRLKALRARFQEPEFRAVYTARILAGAATPKAKAARSEAAKRNYARTLNRPDVRARTWSPETNAKRGLACSDTLIGWCPRELRPEYRRLTRQLGIPTAEARAILAPEIPGTPEHTKRFLANTKLKLAFARERELRSRYR